MRPAGFTSEKTLSSNLTIREAKDSYFFELEIRGQPQKEYKEPYTSENNPKGLEYTYILEGTVEKATGEVQVTRFQVIFGNESATEGYFLGQVYRHRYAEIASKALERILVGKDLEGLPKERLYHAIYAALLTAFAEGRFYRTF